MGNILGQSGAQLSGNETMRNKDSEPKVGGSTQVPLLTAIGMITGAACLLEMWFGRKKLF